MHTLHFSPFSLSFMGRHLTMTFTDSAILEAGSSEAGAEAEAAAVVGRRRYRLRSSSFFIDLHILVLLLWFLPAKKGRV